MWFISWQFRDEMRGQHYPIFYIKQKNYGSIVSKWLLNILLPYSQNSNHRIDVDVYCLSDVSPKLILKCSWPILLSSFVITPLKNPARRAWGFGVLVRAWKWQPTGKKIHSKELFPIDCNFLPFHVRRHK